MNSNEALLRAWTQRLFAYGNQNKETKSCGIIFSESKRYWTVWSTEANAVFWSRKTEFRGRCLILMICCRMKTESVQYWPGRKPSDRKVSFYMMLDISLRVEDYFDTTPKQCEKWWRRLDTLSDMHGYSSAHKFIWIWNTVGPNVISLFTFNFSFY